MVIATQLNAHPSGYPTFENNGGPTESATRNRRCMFSKNECHNWRTAGGSPSHSPNMRIGARGRLSKAFTRSVTYPTLVIDCWWDSFSMLCRRSQISAGSPPRQIRIDDNLHRWPNSAALSGHEGTTRNGKWLSRLWPVESPPLHRIALSWEAGVRNLSAIVVATYRWLPKSLIGRPVAVSSSYNLSKPNKTKQL